MYETSLPDTANVTITVLPARKEPLPENEEELPVFTRTEDCGEQLTIDDLNEDASAEDVEEAEE